MQSHFLCLDTTLSTFENVSSGFSRRDSFTLTVITVTICRVSYCKRISTLTTTLSSCFHINDMFYCSRVGFIMVTDPRLSMFAGWHLNKSRLTVLDWSIALCTRCKLVTLCTTIVWCNSLFTQS